MKIRRGIESRYSSSTAGPRIGKVTRLRDTGEKVAPRRSRRHRGGEEEEEEPSGRRRLIVGWSIGLTVLSLVLMGMGFRIWYVQREEELSMEAKAPKQLTDEEMKIASKFASPPEDVAIGLVKKAMAVRSPDEVDQYFRRGSATPEEVVAYNVESEKKDGAVKSMFWISSMDLEGLLVEGILVSYEGEKGAKERLAYLVPDEKGVWKLDFEGFARVSRPSWEDLLAGRADHSVVRVFLTTDSYFNGPFIDETQWVSVAMASPETKDLLPEEKEILHGYCKTGSKQAKAVERMFSGGYRLRRATLEIRRDKDGDVRQFEIMRVLSEDWVLTPKAYDEKQE